MPFIKRWEYTKNLFARVYITQSCFWLEDTFKFSPIPGICSKIIYLKKHETLNLFAREVPNA